MKKVTHTRKGKQVIDLGTGEVEDHKTINAAKKRSKAIQLSADGALGRGTLRLIPRKLTERVKAFGPVELGARA